LHKLPYELWLFKLSSLGVFGFSVSGSMIGLADEFELSWGELATTKDLAYSKTSTDVSENFMW